MLTSIRLQNFRSYKDNSFEFSAGTNIIVGPNASGKTNLLEAILVLSQGGSYRASDIDLIKFHKPWSRLDGQTDKNDQFTLKLTRSPISKTRLINSKAYKRLPKDKNLPVVIFEPNHLQLLSGSPENRRNYLDKLLEQILPGYGQILRGYSRALIQRNRLLKDNRPALSRLIFPWDIKLSQLGGQITRERLKLTNQMDSSLSQIYKLVSSSSPKIKVNYSSYWMADNYESQYLKVLESGLMADRQKGFTSVGPHREDLVLTFDGIPVNETASRGEMRSAVLALKMFELDTLKKEFGSSPTLLLDDVFSELDNIRRKGLVRYTASFQTFITTVDADAALANYRTQRNIIPIKAPKN